MTVLRKAFLCVFLSFLLVGTFVSTAYADISTKQASSFIDSLKDLEKLSKEMDEAGKLDVLRSSIKQDISKSYTPFTNGMSAMKSDFPDDYKDLVDISKTHGFSSPGEWADVGDQSILAYIAVEAESWDKEGMEKMRNMPPHILEKMPPEAMKQMQSAVAMMDAIEAVPEANKDVIRPLMSRFDELEGFKPHK